MITYAKITSEEYDKLSEIDKRIKVAEFDGWQCCGNLPQHGPIGVSPGGSTNISTAKFEALPDYLNDLNACHKFENGMTEANYLVYVMSVVSGHEENGRIVSATAAQRCKAFVLMMSGLWASKWASKQTEE